MAGLDPTTFLLDAEENATDLGLDAIGSLDLLAIGFCLLLTILSIRMKSFPFMAVSSVGWMIVGFQIASASGSAVIMIFTFAVAFAVLMYGWNFERWLK